MVETQEPHVIGQMSEMNRIELHSLMSSETNSTKLRLVRANSVMQCFTLTQDGSAGNPLRMSLYRLSC